jgi:hypothetical protein
MKNTLPRSRSDLFTLCEKAADGLHTHESSVGLMHNTESVLRSELTAARAANNEYQASKSARLTATETQATADAKAVKFITTTRDVLKPHLGGRYSQTWDEAGFTSQSLSVPGTISKRMELLKSLELYLAGHATYEVAALNVTQAQAAVLHTALSDAGAAVNAAKSDQRGKRDACDASEEKLRNRVRGLIAELLQLIDEDDERWLDFGLRVPDDDSLPEVPANLVVNGGAPGHLVAGWSEAAHAERYRVYKQVVGVDNDFVLATTVTDSDADLNTFASGAHVRVQVTAMSARGGSAQRRCGTSGAVKAG